MKIDTIHYPRDLSKGNAELWGEMRRIDREIKQVAVLVSTAETYREECLPINARTKTGPARRVAAKAEFEIECGLEY